jgi:dipeptidyl aminopeptidase/acylaminoacyl peptidase
MKLALAHHFNMSVLILATGLPVLQAARIPVSDAPLPPLESFFAESARFAERLSPRGNRIAYLGPDATGINRLWVIGTDRPKCPVRVSAANGSAAVAFFWIGGDALLWQTREPTGRARFFLQDKPTDKPKTAAREILPDEKRTITLEGVVEAAAPSILVGLSDGPEAFPDLFRVRLDGNERPELVCVNHHRIITWAWDDGGTPVAGLRWTEGGAKEIVNLRDGPGTVVFRAEPADDARLLFATGDGSLVSVLTNQDTNLTHLECIDLSTGKTTVIASDTLKRVDVEQVVADAKGTMLAVSYADDQIRWQAIDPAFGKLLEAADAVPGPHNLTCLGFDAERSRCLLKRFSSQEPGTVYLYDVASRSLRMLWRERPEMDRATLCETKALDYPARDGTKIPAFLTVPRDMKPPWSVVVFPHGGPRMRTSPGFDGRVQFIASRGYAVLQPNFRGSRGYGKAFMNAGDGQWGKGVMQTDVTDAVDHLIAAGMADKRRVAIFGGSYGGYAALAGLAFTPDHYAAGVCLFGISDLPAYAAFAPTEWQAYAGDTVRRLGDPFTESGRKVLNDLSPVNHAAEFQAPLLIYHGLNDNLIPVAHARRMVEALQRSGKWVDYLLASDEAHGFEHPQSEMAVYRAIELFLHEHLDGQVGPPPAAPVTCRLAAFRCAGQADANEARKPPF